MDDIAKNPKFEIINSKQFQITKISKFKTTDLNKGVWNIYILNLGFYLGFRDWDLEFENYGPIK